MNIDNLERADVYNINTKYIGCLTGDCITFQGQKMYKVVNEGHVFWVNINNIKEEKHEFRRIEKS